MFLTNDHAEMNKEHAGESYRPSNGTEGMFFQSAYCDKCKHDNFNGETCEGACEILAATFAFDVDDKEYPVQWVYGDDGQPVCTAHEKLGEMQPKEIRMEIAESWKKRNGLDYNGWFGFLAKRWLRKRGLGVLVPFDMRMEWRNSSDLTLSVWEWGRYREEKIKFNDNLYASDIPNRLRALGMTSSRDKYIVLKALGRAA